MPVIDSRGRVVQSRQPKSPGTDAGTTVWTVPALVDTGIGCPRIGRQ